MEDLTDYLKRPDAERLAEIEEDDPFNDDDEEIEELERLGVSFRQDDIWNPPPCE
jgi:hypothetical protein